MTSPDSIALCLKSALDASARGGAEGRERFLKMGMKMVEQEPTKRAKELAVTMEIHAELSSTTRAKAVEIDKKFPGYDDMLAALLAIREWLLDTDLIESKDAHFWNEAFVKSNNLANEAIAKATGAALPEEIPVFAMKETTK